MINITKKDKILGVILFIDLFIISILFFNFNFYLIILDGAFSLILISDIIIDIIRNHENKKQLLKNIWFIVISLPFDLIIFYSPDLIPFNIRPLKILRIFKIFKILIILEIFKYFIDKKSQQNLERVNKKIKANTIAYVISTILLLSGIGLSYVENIKGLDIFYFIFVTFISRLWRCSCFNYVRKNNCNNYFIIKYIRNWFFICIISHICQYRPRKRNHI